MTRSMAEVTTKDQLMEVKAVKGSEGRRSAGPATTIILNLKKLNIQAWFVDFLIKFFISPRPFLKGSSPTSSPS